MDFLTARMLDFGKPFIASPREGEGGRAIASAQMLAGCHHTDGIRSVKQKPSRETVSPTCSLIWDANIGPAKQKV